MSSSLENPFPITGTVVPREDGGYGTKLTAVTEYLTESEDGDWLQRAADRARSKYGDEVTVEVRFDGRDPGIPTGFEILGEYSESASRLRSEFSEELGPTEPLRSNIKRVEPGNKGDGMALVHLYGFTQEMADRLGDISAVGDWYVNPSYSEGSGIEVYVGVNDD